MFFALMHNGDDECFLHNGDDELFSFRFPRGKRALNASLTCKAKVFAPMQKVDDELLTTKGSGGQGRCARLERQRLLGRRHL